MSIGMICRMNPSDQDMGLELLTFRTLVRGLSYFLQTGCNPQQFNQDVMGGLMEIDIFFSRMLDYCHGYCFALAFSGNS